MAAETKLKGLLKLIEIMQEPLPLTTIAERLDVNHSTAWRWIQDLQNTYSEYVTVHQSGGVAKTYTVEFTEKAREIARKIIEG